MRDAFNIPRRALILGAGSDIAAATALALASAGTRELILASRDPVSLGPLAREIVASGAEVIETPEFDALDLDGHRELTNGLWDRHGDVDLALVAFGLLGGGVDHGCRSATEVALTNYVGAVSVIDSMVPLFERQGFGSIVVLSSVAAERPRADNYLYASTKAGLDSYAQGLGDALAPDIQVMTVRPGFVATKMTSGLDPAPFAVTPERVASDIVAGLQRQADVVWSPPIVRGVMSGMRHLPRPLYRRGRGPVLISRRWPTRFGGRSGRLQLRQRMLGWQGGTRFPDTTRRFPMVHPQLLKLIGTVTIVLALFLASAAVAFAATGQSIGVQAHAMSKAHPTRTTTILAADAASAGPVHTVSSGR